jgi:SWI/SNF-related matrix-associated actin-dependent regulator 1 of chromatin subfamily A
MIYFDKQKARFYASLDDRIASRLMLAGWERDEESNVCHTKEFTRVIDYIDLLEPSLRKVIEDTQADVKKSCADKASDGFTCPVPPGENLKDFQLASVEFIVSRRSTLLAEEAGLGKTPISIVACNKLQAQSILIICPATIKYNWADNEWPRWTTQPHLSVGVVESDNWTDTDVVILNYDILGRHLKRLHSRTWDMLICDESHRLKSSDSQRTKIVLGGSQTIRDPEYARSLGAVLDAGKKIKYHVPEIPARNRIFATATPMNRPHDLWTIVRACDPKGLGNDYGHFCNRYCEAYQTAYGRDVNGAANLGELGALMRSRFMVRHDPEVVLPELPPLTENVFLLPEVELILDIEEQFVNDNLDALLRLSDAVGKQPDNATDWLLLLGETLLDNLPAIKGPDFAILFSMFAKMRKATGIAKLPSVIQFLKEHTDDGELPTVVFAYHREVMDGLREAFPKHAYVMGGMKAEKRTDMCRVFQRGEVNWFFGNIHAAGEGVTLTRSSYLCFAEMDWQGTAMIQARKRIHRMTQEKPCSIDYLCANKSFDARIYATAVRKMKYIKDTMEL